MTVQEMLFARRDPQYQAFMSRLVPTVPKETMLGIRMPAIRALAREISGTPLAAAFLRELPHRYFDENNLHAALVSRIKAFDEAMAATQAFLPYVDNWATCDLFSPKALSRQPQALYDAIVAWVRDERPYTVRFGLGMLMAFYLEGQSVEGALALAASVRSDEYYVKMMVAWLFATALAKQYDAALPYLQDRRLSPWTHNKAIQKARESLRVPPERKAYLQTLRLPATS